MDKKQLGLNPEFASDFTLVETDGDRTVNNDHGYAELASEFDHLFTLASVARYIKVRVGDTFFSKEVFRHVAEVASRRRVDRYVFIHIFVFLLIVTLIISQK